MNCFLDSNIWLRFLLKDKPSSFKNCLKFFEDVESGRIKPYTSTIVLLEVNYILSKFYKLNGRETINTLEGILKTRNLTLIEKTDFKKAFNLHQKYKIKLADCLITTQVPQKAVLCTYDEDFIKIPRLKVKTPSQLVN